MENLSRVPFVYFLHKPTRSLVFIPISTYIVCILKPGNLFCTYTQYFKQIHAIKNKLKRK